MRRIAVTLVGCLSMAGGMLATVQPANAVFEYVGNLPNVHWAQAYNASDLNAQTYRAFGLFDRTDDWNQQTAIQWWTKRNNDTRQTYNLAMPWAQYVGPAPGATCDVASGDVSVCTAHNHELGVGNYVAAHTWITGQSEMLAQWAPNGQWGHFVWVRIWLDGTAHPELPNGYSLDQRKANVCHELGHAIGLGHNPYGNTCMVADGDLGNPIQSYNTDDNNTVNVLNAHPPSQ